MLSLARLNVSEWKSLVFISPKLIPIHRSSGSTRNLEVNWNRTSHFDLIFEMHFPTRKRLIIAHFSRYYSISPHLSPSNESNEYRMLHFNHRTLIDTQISRTALDLNILRVLHIIQRRIENAFLKLHNISANTLRWLLPFRFRLIRCLLNGLWRCELQRARAIFQQW